MSALPGRRYRLHDRSGRLADVVRVTAALWGWVEFRRPGGSVERVEEAAWVALGPVEVRG